MQKPRETSTSQQPHHLLLGRSPQSCTVTDFEMETFQSFQSIFGLYMMKQYVVKLRKLFPQFYTVFFCF